MRLPSIDPARSLWYRTHRRACAQPQARSWPLELSTVQVVNSTCWSSVVLPQGPAGPHLVAVQTDGSLGRVVPVPRVPGPHSHLLHGGPALTGGVVVPDSYRPVSLRRTIASLQQPRRPAALHVADSRSRGGSTRCFDTGAATSDQRGGKAAKVAAMVHVTDVAAGGIESGDRRLPIVVGSSQRLRQRGGGA